MHSKKNINSDPETTLQPFFILATCLLLFSSFGCSTALLPPSPVPCQRVALDPAPPWTATAAWNEAEDGMLLIDPGSRSLATYGLDGQRRGEVKLDDLAEIDYSVPMRLERTGEGYVLIDARQILHFDRSLALKEKEKPFVKLAERGFSDGSFNDALLHNGKLYGYADFVDPSEIPADDPHAEGTWRRGFVRLQPETGEIDLLHAMTTDNDEYSSYYFYGRRPYVSELGGKIYFLRFADGWKVQRQTRDGLQTVASAEMDAEERADSLYGWNGKLYVLTRRDLPVEEEESAATDAPVLESQDQQPGFSAELLQAMNAAQGRTKRVWNLHEIDPSGKTQRRVLLPTQAVRLRLVPGRGFWAGIEESGGLNLGGESENTTFLFLPGNEVLSGQFTCETVKSNDAG